MNLQKCENGHIYDMDKFPYCPMCAIGPDKIDMSAEKAPGKVYTANPSLEKKEQVILGKFDRKEFHNRTVGWLVCLSGILEGESFVLREKTNRIGRADQMDICLYCEPSVSRVDHAVILYQPSKHCCMLSVNESKGNIRINDKPVNYNQTLHHRDIIAFGNCTCMYIELCGSQFFWKEEE